ncbi:MAG: hypothetical protein JNN05_11240, partial [Candidatus Omnitrophica bacterium]|nr:hypothetical protein [Candidatus Omnitrophota bacterium]
KEKREENRRDIERQQKFLREQREEDKVMREEKIRKIDTLINQSPKTNFELPPSNSEPIAPADEKLSAADAQKAKAVPEAEAKYTVKVLSNNDVSEKQAPKEPIKRKLVDEERQRQRVHEKNLQEERKFNEKLLKEKKVQEKLLKDKELREKKLQEKLAQENLLREKWLAQKNINEKLMQEKVQQQRLYQEKEAQAKNQQQTLLKEKDLSERKLQKLTRDNSLREKWLAEKNMNEKLLQEKVQQQKLLQQKDDQERKLQAKLLQEKQLQQKQEQEKQAKEKQIQKQQSAEREADRRKFEDGLARMYSEAMGYYHKRMYKEARDRFNDVEDISPDYKKTRAYIAKVHTEIINEQKRRETVRESERANPPQKTADVPAQHEEPALVSSPPSGENRTDAVSQALDDFETKSK